MPESHAGFEGEFLYFKPKVNNRVYAARSAPDLSSSTFFVNEPNFKPAYRVGGFYKWRDSEIQARFLYFNGGHSTSVSANGNVIMMSENPFPLDFARSNVHFKYLAGDLAYIHSIYRSFPFRFSALAGLEYDRLRYIEDDLGSLGSTIIFDIRRQSWCWGLGPQIGLEGTLALWNAFSLIGNFRSSLLVSNIKWDSRFIPSPNQAHAARGSKTIKSDWHVLLNMDMRLGLLYEKVFRFFKANIGAGYEFIRCPDFIGIMTYANPVFPDTNSDMKDFIMHGPYASFRFIF